MNDDSLHTERTWQPAPVDDFAGFEAAARPTAEILAEAIRGEVLREVAVRLSRRLALLESPRRQTEMRVEEFKKLLLAPPDASRFDPLAYLDTMRLETDDKLMFLESVARSLGDDWAEDSRNFLEVTIAMGRLQCVLRRVCQSERRFLAGDCAGSVLLAVPPGEEHGFAQCLLEELFRACGWDTMLVQPQSTADIRVHLGRAQFDIVCFSWASGFLAPQVSETLRLVERMPRARRPVVIAGGYSAERRSGWLVRHGVDCICETTYLALKRAQECVAARRSTAALPLRVQGP